MHRPVQRTSGVLRVREAVQGVHHAGKNMVVGKGRWKKNPALGTCRGEAELNRAGREQKRRRQGCKERSGMDGWMDGWGLKVVVK